jgi:carbonic anhydrase
MRMLEHLFENNRKWAEGLRKDDPDFFNRLAQQQKPEYLWIGCADSRVPANQVVGLRPGEVFVHRNIANLMVHSDINCLSVIEYAVSVLKVKHIIVCGHYNCGGVQAALTNRHFGLIDNWLLHIRDTYKKHEQELRGIEDDQQRFDRMCELNVMEQVYNVCYTPMVQEAWSRGQELAVHGVIYRLSDGLLQDLKTCVAGTDEIDSCYRIVPSVTMAAR